MDTSLIIAVGSLYYQGRQRNWRGVGSKFSQVKQVDRWQLAVTYMLCSIVDLQCCLICCETFAPQDMFLVALWKVQFKLSYSHSNQIEMFNPAQQLASFVSPFGRIGHKIDPSNIKPTAKDHQSIWREPDEFLSELKLGSSA